MATPKRARRADNGQFTTKAYAKNHPDTTILEKIDPPKPKPGGGRKKP